MTLIVCIDKKGGMMFGDRRQTKDLLLCERILNITKEKNLFLSPYSAPLFSEKKDLVVSENPAETAGKEDFLFIENTPLPTKEITKIYLYQWNRPYPATRFLSYDPSKEGFTLLKKENFKGSSHEKITEEIWVKSAL
ncbi:MAG: ribonuclease Z [Clostridia bacterium]|nr:ribonuclease Z [Clostridia bacterium]